MTDDDRWSSALPPMAAGAVPPSVERSAYPHPPHADNPLLGQRLGAWRVTGVIGRGGMGVVYRAERDDAAFARTVALKVVRPGSDSTAMLERFVRERETLAAFDHPNIARLLDGGTTAEGVPFFVMEYVDGSPVDLHADAQRLSVSQRLALFLRVCAGVQYAHQSLVVHRDIKPDNVLVTPDGVPKLLDFGVAMPPRSPHEAGPAEPGATTWLLTPDFASPEQLAGRGPITTATDVYSLTVLLHVLLTGQRPYHLGGTRPDQFATVLATRPRRPASALVRADPDGEARAAARATTQARLARRLTGDLDAILARGLAFSVADRYATVAHLARDIERHLAHQPVHARRPTAAYRVSRLVRRHRVAVGLALGVALSLALGAGVATWQARRAAEARALAERRFNDVRELAGTFIFDVHDAIANVPGTTQARATIVETGLRYLDRLSREADADPTLRRELASAYLTMGDAQGRPTTANLGNVAAATASYRQAVALASSALAANPGHLDTLRTLARAQRRLADVLSWAGRLPEALDASEQSHARYRDLAEAPAATVADRLEFGIAEVKLGDVLGNPNFPNVGRPDDALARYDAALDTFTRLDAELPRDDRVARYLGLTYERLGTMYEQAGRPTAAAEAYRESFERRRALAARVPFHTDVERDLAIAYEKLGDIARQLGDLPTAEAHYRGALERFMRLVEVDPSNAGAIRSVAIGEEHLAEVLEARGQRAAALDLLRQARARHRALIDRDQANAQAQCDAARLAEMTGDLRARRAPDGDAAGCQAWEEAVLRHRGLLATAPEACDSAEALARLTPKRRGC